jgi:type IV secretion system protein VirD4
MNAATTMSGDSQQPGRRIGVVLVGILSLVVYAFAVNVATTQYVADHFGHHPLLGPPLVGSFYSPIAWFHWQQQYLVTSRTFFLHVYVCYLLAMGAGFLVYVLVMGFITRSSHTHAEAYGTARFLKTEKEIRYAGLLPGQGKEGAGVYVGAWVDPDGNVRYLRHDGPEHIGVIAPTRSGKGVSLVVPTLLSWPGSLVAYEMKGDLLPLTGGWRATRAGNRVVCFQPAAMEGSISINPLAEIRLRTLHEAGDARNIAEIVVNPDGKPMTGTSEHFLQTARMLVTGCLLHFLYKAQASGRMGTLYDVAFALSDPARPIKDLYEEMLNNQYAPPGLYGDTKTHPHIAAAARDMMNRPEEERGSVLSTAMSYLDLYRDPIVRRNTSRSDLRISDLMNDKSPVSLYLRVGAEDKDRMRPLMRLVLTQIMRVLLRPELKFVEGQAVAPHRHRLLMMLDEFPSLGKLEVFQESLAYMAAYGIKAYLIMQDVAQLWAVYGRDETIISNLHIRVAFAPNKPETAEWLSKMTGTTTVVKEHISTSGRRFGALLQNVSRDFQEQSRPLMTPDEIMRLKAPLKGTDGKILEPGEMLIFVAGFGPIRGTQSLYFLDRVFLERSKLPPPGPEGGGDSTVGSPPDTPAGPSNSAVQPFVFPTPGGTALSHVQQTRADAMQSPRRSLSR